MQKFSKVTSFLKKTFSNQLLYIWLAVFLFCFIFIFNFQGIADFRDANFLLKKRDLEFIEFFYQKEYWLGKSFCLLAKFNIKIQFFWKIFYSLMFSLGLVFSFVFLKKIIKLLISNKIFTEKSLSLNVSLFLLASIYIFNPYILERFFMGHYYVLLGHSIFIPCFYSVLKWFKKSLEVKEKSLLNLKNVFQKDFWYLLLAITLSQFVNTHHGIFLLYFSSVCVLTLFVVKLLDSGLKDFKQKVLQATFNFTNLQFILVAIFNGLFFLTKYAFSDGFSGVNFYLENIAKNQNQFEIIRSFSLKTFAESTTEHLMLGSLGLGGWMNPFLEILNIKQDLGPLSDLALQYSIFLQTIVFSILIIFIFHFIKDFWSGFDVLKDLKNDFKDKKLTSEDIKSSRIKNQTKFLASFQKNLILILIITSLFFTWFLNFGYSNSFFTFFNQFFYNYIPGFYTFREPGKFYGFFLAFLIILISYKTKMLHFKNSDKRSLFFINLFFVFLLISNLLPFLFISQNMNYVKYPEIFARIDQDCQQNPKQKNIFLPTDIYLTTSYSPMIFSINPSSFYFQNCNFFEFNKMTLENNQTGKKFVLKASKQSQELDSIIQKLNTKEISQTEFIQELKKFLKENKIDNILIETYNNPELKEVNDALQGSQDPALVEETIFWYKINNISN
jgi:hypothetical protein